jgi:hypothetical protein
MGGGEGDVEKNVQSKGHNCLREEMDGMGEWQREEVVGRCGVNGGSK